MVAVSLTLSQILPIFHYGFPGVTEFQVLFIRKILTGNNIEFPSFHNGRKVKSEMLSFT